MHQAFNTRFPESSISLIDVQVVILMEIIRDVEVGITVQVDVGNTDAQAVSDDGTVDPGRPRDIREPASVVTEHPVARQAVVIVPVIRPFIESAVVTKRMVEEIHVEIPVEVLIEEGSLGTEPGEIKSVFP
jgi:hypothetical protein